jgi:hypothetical protein
MPYLNIKDLEDFESLIQLYLHAHPKYGAMQAQIRAETGDPHGQHLSQPMLAEMIAWAREKRHITRKDARALRQTMADTFDDDDTPCMVRLHWCAEGLASGPQWTVWDCDIFRCLHPEHPLDPHEPIRAFTLEAACTLVSVVSEDDTVPPGARSRAGRLLAWLDDTRLHPPEVPDA